MVGPVWPYRGGIAQHTSMLCRALAAQCRVKVLSFSRQYPRVLFPGASDRDPTAAALDVGEVEFVLDSIGPWTWRRAVARIAAVQPDLVVMPWWTFFMAPCMGSLARACRRRGLPVRMFCHNSADHERSRWKGALTRWALGKADSFVAQTRQDADNLRRDYPGTPVLVHPHPIYDQFPDPPSVPPRRAKLELLFFGLVREYKGLDVLIEALGRLPDLDYKATVAGEFWWGRDQIEARIAELGLGDRVEMLPRYVSDEEAASLFARADAVVLPYRSATGSGVIPLAYHYRKPVVVTRVGGLPDVVDEGRTGLIVPPDSPDALAAAITDLPGLLAGDVAGAIDGLKKSLTWDGLARVVRSL
ncbi:MAG: glycosyltransferase [Hyphomicrobiales bacterium]|nr:glycosyltransferase [Hyphomicrobiales bacterium]